MQRWCCMVWFKPWTSCCCMLAYRGRLGSVRSRALISARSGGYTALRRKSAAGPTPTIQPFLGPLVVTIVVIMLLWPEFLIAAFACASSRKVLPAGRPLVCIIYQLATGSGVGNVSSNCPAHRLQTRSSGRDAVCVRLLCDRAAVVVTQKSDAQTRLRRVRKSEKRFEILTMRSLCNHHSPCSNGIACASWQQRIRHQLLPSTRGKLTEAAPGVCLSDEDVHQLCFCLSNCSRFAHASCPDHVQACLGASPSGSPATISCPWGRDTGRKHLDESLSTGQAQRTSNMLMASTLL